MPIRRALLLALVTLDAAYDEDAPAPSGAMVT